MLGAQAEQAADLVDERTQSIDREKIKEIEDGAAGLMAKAETLRAEYEPLAKTAQDFNDAGPADADAVRAKMREHQAALALGRDEAVPALEEAAGLSNTPEMPRARPARKTKGRPTAKTKPKAKPKAKSKSKAKPKARTRGKAAK